MKLDQRLIKPLNIAKYLSEHNYRRYTSIIHFLYQQRVVYYAPPSLPTTILENLINNDVLGLFEEYDLGKLEDDLKALEEWGNVLSHPDTGHATRLEDFNKRKLRYECTEETIELERMLEKLNSQMNKVKGQLDPDLVNSLTSMLLELERFKNASESFSKDDEEKIGKLLENIINSFEKLRTDSSDYLGVINSRNIDEAMQNKEISVFRKKFTGYLTDFILSIQNNIFRIEGTINEINNELIEKVVPIITEIYKEKAVLTLSEPLSDEEYKVEFINQWNGLKKWFVYDEFGERFVDYLLKQTDETISRFTKYLEQISERDRLVKNRKKDFEHIARLFKKEADFELCKKVFGSITNVEKPLFFNSEKQREVDSTLTLYEHPPEEIFLKSAKDVATRKAKKQFSISMSEDDLKELQKIEERKQYEEKMIEEFIANGEVVLSNLNNVEPFMRSTILQWIERSLLRGMKGKTEQGINYQISKRSDELIRLHCVDGYLEMPDYRFCFEVSE